MARRVFFLVRRRSVRPFLDFWLVAAVMASCAGGPFAEAGPIVASRPFDFRADNGRSTGGGWVASHSGGGPAAERWRWVGSSSQKAGRWALIPSSGRRQVDRGNSLTGPVIDVRAMLGTNADTFRISLAQRFNFDRDSKGQPLSAGAIAYSLDGGSFIPIPMAAFTRGQSILDTEFNGLASPFATNRRLVNLKAAPAGPRRAWSGSPPLLQGGGLFTGRSLGYVNGSYVPTEAILDFGGSGISFHSIQFRLIEADFAGKSQPGSRWDVRYLQVDVAAPEPSGLVLGGIGCAAAMLALRLRRRHVRRRTEPSHHVQADRHFSRPSAFFGDASGRLAASPPRGGFNS